MWKVMLVTGGNKGIGLAIVETLLVEVEDSIVLLGSRDGARGQAAVDGLVAKLGKQVQGRLQLLVLDVTSQASVDAALAKVKRDHGTIYGVVNNAGGGLTNGNPRETIDLNAYGVRRVCEAFAPIIQPGGRIVQVKLQTKNQTHSLPQVSSGAAPMWVAKCGEEMKKLCADPTVTWEDVEAKIINPFLYTMEAEGLADKAAGLLRKGFGPRMEGSWGEYGLSKAAVNCYTVELGHRFPSITSTSCSPGMIATDLTAAFNMSGKKSPEEGARCPVYLMTGALSSLPGFTSGWYFGSDCLRSPLHK